MKYPRYVKEVLENFRYAHKWQQHKTLCWTLKHTLPKCKWRFLFFRSITRPKEQHQRHQAFLNLSLHMYRKKKCIDFGTKYFGSDFYSEVTLLIKTWQNIQVGRSFRSIDSYTMAQVILAFWLVLAEDLLEDRYRIEVINTKFFFLHFKMAESFEK